MNSRLRPPAARLAFAGLFLGWIASGAAQVTVTGVEDRGIYDDRVTFRIVVDAGHTASATLNDQPVAVGVPIDVTTMDHYELRVRARAASESLVVEKMVQFIVRSSDRGRAETGLSRWMPPPPIPSASAEFAGARLAVMHPTRYPRELDLPVVVRVLGRAGGEIPRPVNGTVVLQGLAGLEEIRLLRGVGFSLSRVSDRAMGPSEIRARVGPLSISQSVTFEESPKWQSVGGTLSSGTVWGPHGRISVESDLTIPAGGTLRVEEGTVLRLYPGVNITNHGRVLLRGSEAHPVVLTATNRVAPERPAGAWGGFIVSGRGAAVVAAHAIFTGSGAARRYGFPPRASHRPEQAMFHLQAGTRLALTNCQVINQAGQIGNGNDAEVIFDRCLLQRAITGGEYVGGSLVINHSALVEFPAIDGRYDAQIADSDYDAIYFTTGTHRVLHSLFAYAKDDAIDSGTGGAGTALVSNCWVEASWHEGLAWSGGGRQTWALDSVLMHNGQGLECGWSTGEDSPLCVGERLLLLANGVGARYGDNYEGTTRLGLKRGFLWLTNSLVLHNRRDVWGRVWDETWDYRAGRMDIRGNWLTRTNSHHPENAIWNPETDAGRLRPFRRGLADGDVGVGLAVWTSELSAADVPDGVPVGLSIFSLRPVTVRYTVEAGGPPVDGSIRFAAGEVRRYIPLPEPGGAGMRPGFRVRLGAADGGEVTGLREVMVGQGG